MKDLIQKVVRSFIAGFVGKPDSLEDKIERKNLESPQLRRDDKFLTDIRDSHDKPLSDGSPAEDDSGMGATSDFC